MPDELSVWRFDTNVLPAEREELVKRRDAAGFEGAEREQSGIAKGTVGLALSGGGIRAGAFAVGVLQGFYRRGLLRFCDYLSTVSGGSYAGAFLASLGHHPHSSMTWGPSAGGSSAPAPRRTGPTSVAEDSAHRVTLAPDRDRRQPPPVQRLIHGGTSLNRPLLFVNNWLPGFLLINIVAISSIVAICALAAYLFRLMYRLDVGRVLSTLGFSDDLSRAFFPAAVIFAVWALFLMVKAVVAYGRGTRVATPTARRLTQALIIVTLICAVSLLGVGDFDTQMLLNYLGIEIPKDVMRGLQSFLQWGLYMLLAVGILPYLTPQRLLHSGATEDAHWAERAIFKVTTSVMFWGLPLLAFALLARENFSYYNNWRDDRYRLNRTSISNWGGFWGQVQDDHRTHVHSGLAALPSDAAPDARQLHDADLRLNVLKGPSDELWHRLEQRWVEQTPSVPKAVSLASSPPTADPKGEPVTKLIDEIAAGELYQRELDLRHSIPARWVAAAQSCLGMHDRNVYDQMITGAWELSCKRELAVAQLNYLLLDPNFLDFFSDVVARFRVEPDPVKWPTTTGFGGNPAEVVAAYQRAQQAREAIRVNGRTDLDYSTINLDYLQGLRDLRLADAVHTYQLECHDDRHENELEWRKGQRQIRASLATPESLLQDGVRSDRRQVAVLNERVKNLEKANFELLRAFYGPKAIQPPEAVFASVVTEADESARLWTAGMALLVFLVAGILVDMNQTTMHGFYRDQLAAVWVVEPEPGARLSLAQLGSSPKGAPYLLVNCAMAFLRKSSDTDEPTEAYLLSRLACGAERFGYAPTSQFDDGQFSLADAMAVSGAAVTPVASRNLAVRALLWLLNFRLGQWLPNPAVTSLRQPPLLYRRIWRRPQPVHLLLSAALLSERQQDFHFVSDGGLHENLGVESLLRRRCRLIIAVDAGADPKGQFEDLVKLLLRMRVRHGITIRGITEGQQLPLALLCPPRRTRVSTASSPPADAPAPRPAPHFVVGVIDYPDGPPGRFVYLRPGLTGDEDSELDRYGKSNPNFPNDATADQFYEPARFEAYRLLGEHIGSKVCQDLFADVVDRNSYQAFFAKVEGATLGTHELGGTGIPPTPGTPPLGSAGGPPSGPPGDQPPFHPPSGNGAAAAAKAVLQAATSGNGEASTSQPAASSAGNGAATVASPAKAGQELVESPASGQALKPEIAAILKSFQAGPRDVSRDALVCLLEYFHDLDDDEALSQLQEIRRCMSDDVGHRATDEVGEKDQGAEAPGGALDLIAKDKPDDRDRDAKAPSGGS